MDFYLKMETTRFARSEKDSLAIFHKRREVHTPKTKTKLKSAKNMKSGGWIADSGK